MTEKSGELANLARIGKLTVEPGTRGEIDGLLMSGTERLADARNEGLNRPQPFSPNTSTAS